MTQAAVLLICLLLSPVATSAQSEWFPVDRLADDLYVATGNLPDGITNDTLLGLYDYLQQHVIAGDEPAFGPPSEDSPRVLVRFVSPQSRLPFPHGTETYGGMTGWATWECLPVAGLCRLLGATDTASGGPLVVLVAATPNRAENLGLVAHELSHVFGAVDGPRCPYHTDYHPVQSLPPDPSDAYWWYGVTGIFTLVPAGVVWEAANDACATSASPDVCADLAAIVGLAAVDA